MNRLKATIINITLLLVSTFLMLYLCEKIYQSLLFRKSDTFKNYRKPPLYAAEWDEVYHKLLLLWNVTQSKSNPDHRFGWLNYKIWSKSLLQKTVFKSENKRSVLMYGDSYAQTLDTSLVVDSLWYKDAAFSNKYQFVNYGVGAYGVDQMYTLFKSTYCKFDKPIVVFSLLTLDLDRSAIRFRDGQKPYYSINENKELIFDSTGFYSSSTVFVKNNPPEIKSYLWRKFLYSDINFLPEPLTKYFTGEIKQIEKIKELNGALLTEVITLLRKSNTDFMFLAFESPSDCKINRDENWRFKFIDDFLKEKKVNYFWANDVLPQKPNPADSSQFYSYYVYGDGHPTPLYYSYVTKAIKNKIKNGDYELNSNKLFGSNISLLCHPTFKEMIDSVIQRITTDEKWYTTIKQSAKEKNISVGEELRGSAEYILYSAEQENK